MVDKVSCTNACVTSSDCDVTIYKRDPYLPLPSRVFKDKELATGKQYKILVEEDKYTLIIHDTKMADDGTYRCKVKNKAGECVTKAKLIVTGKIPVSIV